MNRDDLNEKLPQIIDTLVQSVHAHPKMQHLNQVYLPNRDLIISVIKLMRQLVFPGYFGQPGLTTTNLPIRMGELVLEITDILYEQVRYCLRYRESIPGRDAKNGKCAECDSEAAKIVDQFFTRLPHVRELLDSDVQAAFEGDPAAGSTDEAIYSYPGLFAIMVQRIAHEFYLQNVPLLPRMMTEYAHSLTGIDIHPGATLGKSLFIDHGTGVVIGETTVIGENVKIYQGVTLGALAPAFGQALKGQKRHPTIEDSVTIYAGATILGGATIIGKGATIGGNVFITQSVPAFNRVSAEPGKLRYQDRSKGYVDDWTI